MSGRRKLVAVAAIIALTGLIVWQQRRLAEQRACLANGGQWTGTMCAPGRGPILEREGLRRVDLQRSAR
jgi:hypothetical protein